MQNTPTAGKPGMDENAAGFLKPNAETPSDNDKVPARAQPIVLGVESVAGEEDTGAGAEQLQRKETDRGQ